MEMVSSLTGDYGGNICIHNMQIGSCMNELEEKVSKLENIKKDLELAVHLEKIKKEEDNYFFYIKTDKKLKDGSLILDENNITVYFKYEPKDMKLYSIKNRVKDSDKEKCCDCSNSSFIEDKALVSLLNEDIFFYEVRVLEEDIKELNEDSAIVSKLNISKRVFSDKQSKNAPDPFLDIKYKINRIDTEKNTDGKQKHIALHLTNPLWNNNTAYMQVDVSEEELNSTLTKEVLSSILLERINKAQTISDLIDKLEED